MKSRDIVTGFIILVLLVGGALLIRNLRNKNQAQEPTPTPSIEEKVKETFNGLTIPSDIERTELKDVSGGGAFGVATRTEMLANLPQLPAGQYYQGKLENGSGQSVLLGTFRVAKGGYILEYDSSKYSGYNKVIVVLGDKTLLEGSF